MNLVSLVPFFVPFLVLQSRLCVSLFVLHVSLCFIWVSVVLCLVLSFTSMCHSVTCLRPCSPYSSSLSIFLYILSQSLLFLCWVLPKGVVSLGTGLLCLKIHPCFGLFSGFLDCNFLFFDIKVSLYVHPHWFSRPVFGMAKLPTHPNLTLSDYPVWNKLASPQASCLLIGRL